MKTTHDKKKASYYFHHPEYGFNCAQAITHTWGCSKAVVNVMKNNGGGRAEDGKCGALYGALQVLKNVELRGRMLELFAKKAGSNYCREIKNRANTSCVECVDIADYLLQKIKPVSSLLDKTL